jgi:hypothetical protein
VTVATDVGVGDSETPWLDVTPADVDTVATLTVTPVQADGTAGTPYDVTATGGTVDPSTSTQRWTADQPVVYDQPGRWLLTWTVTGTGEGVETREVYVNPTPTAGNWPVWAPALADAAGHVPYLTVDTTTPGAAAFLGTFTPNTSPTDTEAAHHLTDAVTSVSAAVGTVNDTLHGQARLVAALRAAAAIQRAYPRDPTDPNERAASDALDRRADAELSRLITANTAAGEAQIPSAVLPQWSFPAAPAYGDWLL